MVKSKKLLSLFLAVVMVLSVFTVMASAIPYTRGGTEGASDVDVKYTVEKIDVIPESLDGASAELAGDNFYAVTVWMKSAKPVDTFMAPVYYNKKLFAPVTLTAEGATYPYGAGLDQDSYYTDMGEGVIYAYSLGDYMNNTGMYKADGTTAATKALAKCIGLGNSNSAGIKILTEIISPDHPNYTKWSANAALSDNIGVVYTNLNVAANTKTAYFNTLEGIATYTDWVNMFTFYFEALEDDVVGAEFGVFVDDAFGFDGCYDANGKGYYESAAKYKATVPSMNVVSNAVIEASAVPTSIVNPMKGQIRFDKNENGGYAGKFDVRAIARITGKDFDTTFGSIENAIASIESVGFVFAQGSGDYAEMVAVAEAGESGNGYTYAPVDFISTSFDEGNYTFSCIVDDVKDKDKNETLYALAYIKYVDADGATQWAFYTSVQTVTFKTLYDAHYNDAFKA